MKIVVSAAPADRRHKSLLKKNVTDEKAVQS